ncbi:RNA polymerase sigma factor [Anatilimnocola floriformis]|uniref:RNA polymerase sigma factor n=1 Tax=Anatilimnocola floriformis TaxID=2948575 RepID=UPI0020C28991|nr:sigma-70 family RNA polymerase sigma factor [Anatilimnocola floriformis]
MADRPRPDNTHSTPNRAGSQPEAVACSSKDASADPADQRPLPALPDLIREFAAPLFRYAFRLTGQASDAEDLVQQTFLVAQQKLHQVREAERASAWLYAVLRSCFLKSRRKPIPQTMEDSFPLDSLTDHRGGEPVSDDSEPWLDREALQLALAELPDEFKIVVLMFYFEELSYKDIAEQLEIPIGTVMSRLSRGKAHLRRRLEVEKGLGARN